MFRTNGVQQSLGNHMRTFLAIGASVFIIAVLFRSSKEQNDSSTSTRVKKDASSVTILKGEIQCGSAIPYYLCEGDGKLDMVLLHGASFTKEDWKTSGLLQKLSTIPQLGSVVALDLSHRSKHDGLKEALHALQEQKIISQTSPIALVTPSASGESVVDWASTKNGDEIAKYIKYWIPVASPAISRAEPEWLESLPADKLKILAVYGSKDARGKQVSLRLEQYTKAKVVELNGSHPCYLDSPEAFVSVIQDFLR